MVQPLPTAYLIFRAPSQAAGKCWMDALELSLRCSALLLRSTSGSGNHAELVTASAETETMTHETQWSEADYEKHFYDHGKFHVFLLVVITELSWLVIRTAFSSIPICRIFSQQKTTPRKSTLYLFVKNSDPFVSIASDLARSIKH